MLSTDHRLWREKLFMVPASPIIAAVHLPVEQESQIRLSSKPRLTEDEILSCSALTSGSTFEPVTQAAQVAGMHHQYRSQSSHS
jgi:hypothetical protein